MLLSYIVLYIISVLSFAAEHVSVFHGVEAFERPKCRFVPSCVIRPSCGGVLRTALSLLPSPCLSLRPSNSTMSASQYPQAPPTYQPAAAPYKDAPEASDPASPLLGTSRGAGPSRSGAIYDMPAPGDLPDDFKACYVYLDCYSDANISHTVRCDCLRQFAGDL
jgi:hypothetical protein